MIPTQVAVLPLIVGAAATMLAPPAHANDVVTYEVVSDSISQVNGVEYVDAAGRKILRWVPLPWRLDVPLDNARGPTGPGAQVRADWLATARPSRWVTVRIYDDGKLLCQSTLDVGNATCYGNTPEKI
ncbi:hypothetical protein JF780_26525 [Mycobacterium intracellulare]|uniref:hypothetical protein n=1 Tax=Mycobacterium intracellulare TaxID=1767 RepID=UPI001CDA2ED3|nr:hypothetical protein [Mycobacterium intracellulare]MCA2276875.1 hypothetical protein [Mycobacterium intracellulare]MCA2328519.1 hypothetical protein [Mycobacterium intracellulare]